MVRGVAQPGSASVLGTEGREFESLRPDHLKELIDMIGSLWGCLLCSWQPVLTDLDAGFARHGSSVLILDLHIFRPGCARAACR